MQSTLNQFNCGTICKHKECQRNAHLGLLDRNEVTQPELTGSSILLENIVDLSHTLVQIMILCGIHECKAKKALDIITYSFLHHDLITYCLDKRPVKKLRKEDIFHELGSKCQMNRVEAHLCYNIIKRAFKAFYFFADDLQQTDQAKDKNQPSLAEECVYVHAAKKTADTYGQFEGLADIEQRGIEAKMKALYKKFYDRMQLRKAKPTEENCNCCFCSKSRGQLLYAPPPPTCALKTKSKKSDTCPYCCKRKKSEKLIHSSCNAAASKCPVCHRSLQFCSCPKYQLDLNWVGSIWSRPDMHRYYVENIEKKSTSNDQKKPQEGVSGNEEEGG